MMMVVFCDVPFSVSWTFCMNTVVTRASSTMPPTTPPIVVKIRPKTVFGLRSPYPIVDTVMSVILSADTCTSHRYQRNN